MIDKRQEAVNNISRTLAITKYDIENRQSINDLSLNIHGENYFRDIFNFVYDVEFENDNFNTQNSACIDLIDKKRKIAYQITTTRNIEKMHNTFKILQQKKFKGYDVKIFYLLDKAKPNKNTQKEFDDEYGISLKDNLLDRTDLIRDINNLPTDKLIELNERYFKNISDKYTDNIVLDLVCRSLVSNVKTIQQNYDDDFGSIDTDKKLTLNNINPRISNHISSSLDYINLVNYDDDSNLLENLRTFVLDDLYKNTLIEILRSKESLSKLKTQTVNELQECAVTHKLDFNKIIFNLYNKLHAEINITDHNSMSISWIIIAYFFEICDVGVKE